jgi:hypothetical protein
LIGQQGADGSKILFAAGVTMDQNGIGSVNGRLINANR